MDGIEGLLTFDRTSAIIFCALALLVGLLYLQWRLSRHKSAAVGLILPVLTVLLSVGMAIFVGREADTATMGDAVVAGMQAFLVTNLLTLMEWSIYKKSREARR